MEKVLAMTISERAGGVEETCNPQDALAYNEAICGSRLIVYDGVNVLAPVRDIRQAITLLSNGDRQHTVMLARRNIEKTLPAVRHGTASQYATMMCARDVAVWFANEVIEGRETLETNEP